MIPINWKHLPEGAGEACISSELKIQLRRKENEHTHDIKRNKEPFDSLDEILTATSGS